jgi:hypothetical protein
MFSNKKRRRIKPFARPTSFDFNAVFDLRHYQKVKYGNTGVSSLYRSSNSDEDFQIMEGEVLMQQDDAIGIRRYGDHQMHCFGFANGLLSKMETRAFGKDFNELGKKTKALTQLKYAGVAVTGFKPDTDIYEQGFVVTVAGLNTLFNNGQDSLFPGDIICADVPPADVDNEDVRGRNRSNAQGGIPGSKYQFTITSFTKLKEALEAEQLSPEEAEQLASKFIMGTAMSFSKRGSPVDVVLHRCNVIRMAPLTDGGGGAPVTTPTVVTGLTSSRKSRKGKGGL